MNMMKQFYNIYNCNDYINNGYINYSNANIYILIDHFLYLNHLSSFNKFEP